MPRTVSASAALLLGCAVLAGCQTAIYPKPNLAYIDGVEVSRTAREGSQELAANVRDSVLRRAARLPRVGQPKCLAIVVTNFHVKNPVMSLLVGDSNRLEGTMKVVDRTTGRVDAQVPVAAQNTYLVNGIIGAVHAASQEPANVERQLTDDFGLRVAERLYGAEAVRNARPSAAPMPVSAAGPAVTAPAGAPPSAGAPTLAATAACV